MLPSLFLLYNRFLCLPLNRNQTYILLLMSDKYYLQLLILIQQKNVFIRRFGLELQAVQACDDCASANRSIKRDIVICFHIIRSIILILCKDAPLVQTTYPYYVSNEMLNTLVQASVIFNRCTIHYNNIYEYECIILSYQFCLNISHFLLKKFLQ